jgi:hypothetical protein
MSMSTGQKIALGCGCAVLVVGGAAVAFLGVGAYWAKGKLKQAGGTLERFSAKAEEISKWETQANANPFTPPADGVIQEAQLRRFLDVRKDIYAVYEQHKPEFESLAQRTKGQKDLNISQTIEAGGRIASLAADIRLTQAKALAGYGMSEAEYRYIQVAVYKSFYASAMETEAGKQPAEQAAEALQQERGAVREALEAARRAGVPGAAGTSEAEVQQTEQAAAQLGQGLKALTIPQANIDLFRKYEADIKKYAMNGLAFVGL